MYYDIKESGERIRLLRIHSGYTQEKIAQELNIDRSLLSYVESGKKGCSVDLLIQLSSVFRVSIDYLVLGSVNNCSEKSGSTEQLRESIESLIRHLEAFRKTI